MVHCLPLLRLLLTTSKNKNTERLKQPGFMRRLLSSAQESGFQNTSLRPTMLLKDNSGVCSIRHTPPRSLTERNGRHTSESWVRGDPQARGGLAGGDFILREPPESLL